MIGIFFFSSVQLISVGILGEYIGSIHTHVRKRPLVVERERVNFEFPAAFPTPNRRPRCKKQPDMDNAPGRGRSIVWSWVFPTLLAVVLLYYSLRGVEWGGVWATIITAKWRYLAGAALISSGSFFLRSYRWRVLLNAEARLDIPTVFWATMAGFLGNSFLPARAGELVRSFIISSRSSLSKTYVLTTALSQLMVDAIALVLASSVVLLGINPKPNWLGDASRVTAVTAGIGLLAIAIVPHTGNFCEAVIRRLPFPAGFRVRLLEFSGQILLGLRAFHSVGRLTSFVVWTVVIWTLDCCGAMVIAYSLGLELPFRVALLLLAGLGLGSALPSTPGYVGIYQFVAVTVLTPFGVSRDAALAYILITQAVGYVVIMTFGLPGLYKFKGWRQATIELEQTAEAGRT